MSPEPLVASSVLAVSLLIASDNEPAKKALLPKVASGECIVGAGFAGRYGFDDAGDVAATTRGADVLLKGTVHHVYPALCANEFLIAARGADGLALYRVPAAASGLTVKDELRANTLEKLERGEELFWGGATC